MPLYAPVFDVLKNAAVTPQNDPSFQTDIAGATVANMRRDFASDGTGVTATGILCWNNVNVYPGLVINKISYWAAGTPANLPLNQWFCLGDPVGLTILAVTPDDTTNPWLANLPKTLTLGSPYTVPAGIYRIFAGQMVKATTPPNSMGRSTSITTVTQETPQITARSTTGLTTPLTVGTAFTLTAGFGIPYCVFS